MFFPTVEEHDVYAANGVMVDEINSVCEYIDEVLLGDKDDTPEDEDDDEPHFYQVVKTETYYYQQSSTELKTVFEASALKTSYPNYSEDSPLTLSYDIVGPPPKA